MRKRVLWIGMVISACAVLWSACGGGQRTVTPPATSGTKAGNAPNFSLRMLDGRTVELGKLAGKPVVLHFWGTW